MGKVRLPVLKMKTHGTGKQSLPMAPGKASGARFALPQAPVLVTGAWSHSAKENVLALVREDVKVDRNR